MINIKNLEIYGIFDGFREINLNTEEISYTYYIAYVKYKKLIRTKSLTKCEKKYSTKQFVKLFSVVKMKEKDRQEQARIEKDYKHFM